MNLAFVIKTLDSRGGGAERVLTQITSELVKRGHEIILLTFGKQGEPDFYAVDAGVQRVWLGIGDVQARSGVMDLLRQTIQLRRAIRELAPDAAVGFMHSAYVPLALALSTSSIPVVASEHISYDHFRHRRLEALLLQIVAPLLARMTAISDAIRDGFPRHLARRMEIVPNPVAPVNCAGDPAGGRPKLLLNVGRLTEQKDQRTLIEAFARIAPAHPDWILRIVGEGPLRRELEGIIASFGLQDRVQLAGVIADIEHEYCSAQLFAVSSRYESFGLATAEALSAGIPAIGFADCPGTNELVQDGLNGLLVGGADRVSAFAAGLDRLMASGSERMRLGRAAPATVSRFALGVIVDEWEALLRDVVNE